MVRTNGIEPSRDCSHGLLRPARLPVPPRPREKVNVMIRIYGRKFKKRLWFIFFTAKFVIFKLMQKAQTKNYLRENLAEVQQKIDKAARKVGRNSEDVKLIAVSKTHPVEILNEAIEAGASIFGENRVQEAEEKIYLIKNEIIEWHLIGHLQKNKARKAVQLFDVIHTLDSIELTERLERICQEEERQELQVLIQVDLAKEATKNGIEERDLPQLINFLHDCDCLKLSGLMIIPPYFEDAENVRPFFRKLREIRDKILPDGELSMGMSHDFEIAVEEGATLVRVGTAIFGARENY